MKMTDISDTGGRQTMQQTSVISTPRVRRAVDVYVALQAEIESGQLTPGTVLDERTLASRFGVSRTPIREALQQLAARDMVQIEPHVGAHVARLSVGEVRAMLEYISEMEALCAKLAARRVDPVLRRALQTALEQGRQAGENAEDYRLANTSFHDAIYVGCHSIFLAAQIRTTRRLLQRYRVNDFHSPRQIIKSQEDHVLIAQAIMAGDELGAVEAMLQHLPSGTTGFSEYLAKVPMHFFGADRLSVTQH
ncbi:MAG: GntR family transcriptional regulator [Rhodoferax sp.]|nr:GntR family transcriptional regulator [Rhodoferax sp.]